MTKLIMDTGYVEAKSTNLPKIDTMMVAKFVTLNPDFCSAEPRNVKIAKSAKESYSDDAIGYVQLKRDGKICTVKCKVSPQHKVSSKQYAVSVQVDEEKEEVTSGQCLDCHASEGGCKHVIAFLMWLHRRSEEPSCAPVQCYWKKSKLSNAGSTLKILTTTEICKCKQKDPEPNTSLLTEFVEECKKRKIENCLLVKHTEDYTIKD